MAAAAAAAIAIPAIMGLVDKFSNSSSTDAASTLTSGQQSLMDSLSSGGTNAIENLYSGLGSLSSDPQNAYEALPDFNEQFQQQYGDPMTQQHQTQLAQLAGSGELHSGGNIAQNFRANQLFNTNLASARAGMMMTERAAQQSSAENSYNRQLQASQLLSNLSTAGLGVKGVENIVSQNQSALGTLGNVGSASTSISSSLSGLSGSQSSTPDESVGSDADMAAGAAGL